MTSFEELCGKGKDFVPFDQVPIECARDYSCEDADMTWQLRAAVRAAARGAAARARCSATSRCRSSACSPRWNGTASRSTSRWFASLKERFERERKRVEQEIYVAAGEEFNINSNPQLREILFEKLELPVLKKTSTGAVDRRSVLQQLADDGHQLPVLLMEYRELSKLESTYIDALPTLRASAHAARAHVVQPDDGGHRAAVVERAQSSEHSDSARAGPRRSPRVRSAPGMDARRRRLLADRAAAARASVGRSGVRAGVQVRRRHPSADRGADLRRAARAR